MKSTVIVGGGQAGAALAARLRTLGCPGPVTILAEEQHKPYQRPPLSKGYLLGTLEKERLYLRSDNYWIENNIEIVTGARVQSIDTGNRVVVTGDERVFSYSDLVLATGASARQLPSSVSKGCRHLFTIRTLNDIELLRPRLRANAKLLIVGGGFIGLEAAAVARKFGMDVTLIENSSSILQRVVGAGTAAYFKALHVRHGVSVIEGVSLTALEDADDAAKAVLSDGTQLRVDVVIAGIGAVPNVELAEQAGLALENGVASDRFGRTSHPDVWAIGDCCSFPLNGRRVRIESVGNAIEQAETVAENIMGQEKPYVPKPWFWSDQYETKLQIAGIHAGFDQVVQRMNAEDSFSHWYYQSERLIAVEAVNDARSYMIGKRLLDAGVSPRVSEVFDGACDLRRYLG